MYVVSSKKYVFSQVKTINLKQNMKLKTLFFVIVMHTSIAVSASPIDNVIFRVKINGKWGYVNAKGEYIVTPQYSTMLFCFPTMVLPVSN